MEKQKEENNLEFKRIDISNKASINASLEVGQHIRNASGRIFEIAGLDEQQVFLKALNPDKTHVGQVLTLGRKVFVDLYYLKNYDQIRNTKYPRREIMDAKATGADRFLL